MISTFPGMGRVVGSVISTFPVMGRVVGSKVKVSLT
jgi:hypothetical protein